MKDNPKGDGMMKASHFFAAGLLLATVAVAQPVSVEEIRCLPSERNAVIRATATVGAGQAARLYFRWDRDDERTDKNDKRPKDERSRKAFYWVSMEPEPGNRFWVIPPKPERRNERVIYYAAVVDMNGVQVARTDEKRVPVRKDCEVSLTLKERGVAQNLTIGETVKEQQGAKVWGFLCDGIVTRVNHENIRRADEECRSCVVAWWRKNTLLLPPIIGTPIVGIITREGDPEPSPSRPNS
jgi:hypothetical protein